MTSENDATWHGTTILSVRKGGQVVVAGDGQVTLGHTVIKSNARKVRRLGDGSILSGFAGATADAFTLFERLEAKLEQYPGQLMRACVELAKDWRTDRYLRRLEAMMAVAGRQCLAGLDRHRRRIGTRRRSDRHWFGRVLRARRRAGAQGCGKYGCRGRCPQSDGDCRGDLHLYERICDFGEDRGRFMTNFSPREIVSELDRFIIGQDDAKRSVAIALRNRWRRMQLDDDLREEVLPKNILMIGPTGVGKTEIARRLARLAEAPFVKVEATKFTEVGYVGRDVESIVRDLLEALDQHDTRETPRRSPHAGRSRRGRSRARCFGRRKLQP